MCRIVIYFDENKKNKQVITLDNYPKCDIKVLYMMLVMETIIAMK